MTSRRNVLRAVAAGAIIAVPFAVPLAALAQGAAPYKIGTILSVTGPGAFLGDHMKRGMELAIEEINAKGGINGRKIEWVFYDAETQSTKAVTATRRLIDTAGGTGVSRVNSVGVTSVAGTNGGWVPFSQGIHNSLLDPGPSPAATFELQGEIAQFLFDAGDQITITNGAVIVP